jgi:hypothetical protein
MQNAKVLIAALCVGAILLTGLNTASSRAQEPSLLPTDALHQIHVELSGQPGKQKEIAMRYLPKVKTTDLSRDEQFALGEVYFVALMPKEARDAFAPFTGGRDMQARIARQRILWMTMAADRKYDGIEPMLVDYRRRFKPVAADTRHLSGAVFGIAEHYQSIGDHERAVKLVLEEVESLPGDAPYHSLRLPAQLFTSFEKTGRAETATRLLDKARATLRAMLPKPEVADGATTPPAHRPGVYHRREEGLTADLPEKEQRIRRARILLGMMDADLERAKQRQKPVR